MGGLNIIMPMIQLRISVKHSACRWMRPYYDPFRNGQYLQYIRGVAVFSSLKRGQRKTTTLCRTSELAFGISIRFIAPVPSNDEIFQSAHINTMQVQNMMHEGAEAIIFQCSLLSKCSYAPHHNYVNPLSQKGSMNEFRIKVHNYAQSSIDPNEWRNFCEKMLKELVSSFARRGRHIKVPHIPCIMIWPCAPTSL